MAKQKSNLDLLKDLEKDLNSEILDIPNLGNHHLKRKMTKKNQVFALSGAINLVSFVKENGGFGRIIELCKKHPYNPSPEISFTRRNAEG